MTLSPLVLAGPTASGKSALAFELALRFNGEIVCADSRQIYRGMRIVSAGPTLEECSQVPHHLYQNTSPLDGFDAGQFLVAVDAAVDEIQARGKWPIIVGGAGLYLRAFRYGLDDAPPRDEGIRTRLAAEAAAMGLALLHARLVTVDSKRAAEIAPGDGVRVIRALEIFEITGRQPSSLRVGFDASRPPRRAGLHWVRFSAERTWLNERINQRAAMMFDEGLVEEANELTALLPKEHPLLSTMGTFEALEFSAGRMSRSEAISAAAQRQRRYAKRQRTWFQKEAWWSVVDLPASPEKVHECIAKALGIAAFG